MTWGYSIVYDESLFSYEQAGGIDTYWWKAQEPGKAQLLSQRFPSHRLHAG